MALYFIETTRPNHWSSLDSQIQGKHAEIMCATKDQTTGRLMPLSALGDFVMTGEVLLVC